MVTFDKSAISMTHNEPNYVDVVKFMLNITNGSNTVIPDPVAYKGARYVKFYINGKLINPKALFDENQDVTDKDNIIAPSNSQSFYCDWLASSSTPFQKTYGKKFTVQWAYLNIRSKKVRVDMVNHTIKTLN